MNSFITKNKFVLIGYSILVIAYLFLGGNPLPFDSDKPFIIDIWKDVFSWQAYQGMKHNILDVQPIRDLYFWIVVNINDKAFIFLNALMWLSSLALFTRILDFGKYKRDILLLLIIGLHPVAIWSIMWPSASKHLLSFVFLSIAIHSCYNLKEGLHLRHQKGMLLFYLLSVFTQPIFILFPLFIVFELKSIWKKHLNILLPLTFIFLLGLGINWYYYNFTYVEQTGTLKSLAFNEFSIAMNLLGFSRSMTQVFMPIQTAFYYTPADPLNLIGIPLFFIMTFIAHLRGALKGFLKGLFFFLPLALIYFKATNIFVSDTYLLLPLFFLIPLLRDIKFKYVLPLYALFISFLGAREIYYLSEPGMKLEVSYQRSPDCKNALLLAAQQLYKIQIPSFQKTISEAMGNNCLLEGINAPLVIMDLYTAKVFFDKEIDHKNKLELLEKGKIESPLINILRDKLNGDLKSDYKELEIQKDLFRYIKKL